MNRLILASAILAVAMACTSEKSAHHQHADNSNPNQTLHNEVMNVHDEVMPKMEELYKLRKALKTELDGLPPAAAARRTELQGTLALVDSASNAMMVWMRGFDPLPDSAGAAAGRAYLEAEMEKIKSVKTLMLETLDKARALQANP
jgi:hypothetical protein